MSAHVIPSLLKIDQYILDKTTFTLTHQHQRRDSTGRKCRIEYPCDRCTDIYITKLRDEFKKQRPWLCRSCRVKDEWQDPSYRAALLAGITDATRHARSVNAAKRSKDMWLDPEKRAQICRKLRERSPDVYSHARRSMRKSVVIEHWKDQRELVCVGSYEVAFVKWCNAHEYDFDWQISHAMPDGRQYIIDARVHDGPLAPNWIEIKGWMTKIGQEKWDWFRAQHDDAALLGQRELKELGIL